MSMPQVRIHGVEDVRLDSVEKPVIASDDVLVQVSQCGICGSDIGYISMGGLGMTQPMPLGHELAGTVAEVGDKVCLKGNVDCAGVLQSGSPHETRTATRACIEAAGAGGGYICSSSNTIHRGVKPQNYRAMLEELRS